jgi:GDP-L-fucose synthase
MPALKKSDSIFIAGHRGLVGSSIRRRLLEKGYTNLIVRTRAELDLTDVPAVRRFLEDARPNCVVLAAAKVGGIQANKSHPADFIGENLGIQQSVIWGAHQTGVEKLLFLGSSCIYPRLAPQPMPEESLMTGPLEPTNAPYAVAKIAGLTLCASLREQYGREYGTVMPPNVYGPGDNFDPQGSHVMAAMIRRFHEALPDRDVVCWGSGTPRREFLFTDDLGDAIVFLLEQESLPSMINVGTGESVSIKHLAETVQAVVGHKGEIGWDTSKPDGFPEKTMDVSKLASLGWRPRTSLEEGISVTYDWFKKNSAS